MISYSKAEQQGWVSFIPSNLIFHPTVFIQIPNSSQGLEGTHYGWLNVNTLKQDTMKKAESRRKD